MSKYIATRAIRGANAIVAEADALLKKAIAEKGAETPVQFPNTAYFLPVIYGMLAHKVETLGDMEFALDHAKKLIHPLPGDNLWVPYLGETLDSGQATLLAAEIIEGIRFVYGEEPQPYPGLEPLGMTDYPEWEGNGHLNGPIDDIQLRTWGIPLVDGRMPGFAAIVGAARSNEAAVGIVRELQKRNILIFLCGNANGRSMIDQLQEEGVEMGFDTYIVPFGMDTLSAIYPVGFATRSALTFGGVKAGQWRDILLYNKFRVFAFVLALGEVDDLKYAAAAGAISYGFPTIADTIIPEILPTGVTQYEHVTSMPWDEIEAENDTERAAKLVQRAIEVRGVKIRVTEVPVPVAYGSAFEGEVVRRADMRIEFGGKKSRAFEYLRMADMDEVEDHKIEVIGPGFEDVEVGKAIDLGILIEVAGRKMQEDFEPVLERQVHYFINGASGVQHIGQRDIAWIRISKGAVDKGFDLTHFGEILYARFHADFGAIVDKVQVKIITEPALHAEWLEKARAAYEFRNQRLADLTDEAVETFYDCTLCQSFAPTHVCIVSPQRLGLCGAYNWLDCKASNQINPTGPNQPVNKGKLLDPVKGYWAGTNENAVKNSQGTVQEVALYSIMENPMTACGCFECIVMYLPEVEGVMVVSREDPSMTPAGMTFSTLAGMAGGGLQTPGVMGVGKFYLTSPKFVSADGGFKRVVWMSSFLKDSMSAELAAVAEREGIPNLIDLIADERKVTSVDELVDWVEEVKHPVQDMGVMQAVSGAVEVEEEEAPAVVAAAPVVEAKVEAPKAAEPVVAKPVPVAAHAPAAAPQVTADADVQQIAEITAGIVVDRFRDALVAALQQLGGSAPIVPVAPVVIQPVAPEVAAPPVKKIARPEVPPWTEGKESLDFAKEKWMGTIREVTLGATSDEGGTRTSTVTVGGQNAMPFLDFEGEFPNKPLVAIEIQDRKPDDWSPLLAEAWGDAMNDPGEWAKAAEKAGASLIMLQLSLTDADGNPNTPENAVAAVRKVLAATGLPLVVLGPGQVDADNDLLVPVAEAAAGERLLLGVCEEKNYRTIVAAALAHGQLVIARTAMDVNLAKQLNILISDMGLPVERVIMDPTCAGVGYGMEYGYSVMERLRLAALQGDGMTQLPMIVTVGYEAWRQKESKVGEGVPEAWGDWKERAINWEVVTASTLVESAADIVVLRHPESVRRIHAMIDELTG
ncbi:MAG: CO dehydrogenase/CO-methylating acetyl-CoA synthase complex subunit beta [Chloroflexi bacterium]|nr:CO dehydrogenase/CO-methylating acetyl-CoA synthase complex subunit beta [Chloroflexota bacterium]